MIRKPTLRALAVTLILLAIVGCTSQSQPTQSQPTVDFAAHDLNGNPVRFSDYRGKIIVLNFWAIGCPPCRIEMPDLEAAYQEYRDQGVVILAVNVVDSPPDIIAFAQEYGLTFPILRDTKHEAVSAFNVARAGLITLPTTFFVDRQGQVRHRQVGAVSRGFVAQQIESLF